MNAIFDIIAIPLGWVLWAIYQVVPNYIVSMLLFTFLVKLCSFPLSLKQQKTTADRARLAPRLERLQKKYGQDPRKLQEKQMQLYEKEGVSMTGGCMPMLVTMLVLFGVIAVIYKPVTHLVRVPSQVIETSITVVQENTEDKKIQNQFKAGSYYRELRMLQGLEANKDEIVEKIDALGKDVLGDKTATEYYEEMIAIREQFNFFGGTLLENPNYKGWTPNWLWLLPILSAITALCTSMISMKFTKAMTPPGQQGQGCSNFLMIGLMPIFSLYITFTVPGGVGIYWIFSNVLALIQTVILNNIYNPAKIKAQAEIEYEERRRRKAEDKKRLAESRAKEQREIAKLNAENGGKKPAKKAKTEESNLSDTTSTSSEDANTDTEEGKE